LLTQAPSPYRHPPSQHPESEILAEAAEGGPQVALPALPSAMGGPLRRVGEFFGLFAYVVRDGAAALRIADAAFPCSVQLDSAFSDAAAEGSLTVVHVSSPLFTSPKSMPGQTDIQRMDQASFISMQKAKLVEEGQIHASLARHPSVVQQIADAYRKKFGAESCRA
jgi:hypothetical protein